MTPDRGSSARNTLFQFIADLLIIRVEHSAMKNCNVYAIYKLLNPNSLLFISFLIYLSCKDKKTDKDDQNEETKSTYRFDIVYKNTGITYI